MRRKFFCLFCIILVSTYPTAGHADPDVSARNGVMIDQSSGRVLYEKKAHEKRPVASITKLMTAIIAIESGKMDEKAKASERAIHSEGSSIYMQKGEEMTIHDLVYGLMLRSGNDAAVTISEHIGGSMEGFVYLMNEKARWLGMTDTHFTNPHGLDWDGHYSTAYDIAILMQYAMENDIFRKITGTSSYKADGRVYSWKNKNRLLTSYEYCIGGKTGFTSTSGRTLVTSAKKKDLELIAVTLDAPDDWRDHISLYEWGFRQYKPMTVATAGRQNYALDRQPENLTGYIHSDVTIPTTDDEKIHTETFIKKHRDEEDEPMGKTVIYASETPVAEVAIHSEPERGKITSFRDGFVEIIKQFTGASSIW